MKDTLRDVCSKVKVWLCFILNRNIAKVVILICGVGTSEGKLAPVSSVVSYAKQHGVQISHVDIKHADMRFFNDAQVEIHFKPSYSYNFIYDHRLTSWFGLKAKEQFENFDSAVGFAYPTISFNLVYSLLHIYRHLFLRA